MNCNYLIVTVEIVAVTHLLLLLETHNRIGWSDSRRRCTHIITSLDVTKEKTHKNVERETARGDPHNCSMSRPNRKWKAGTS